MNDDELFKKIDEALGECPVDRHLIELSAAAVERRFHTVLTDLGLQELAPTVKVLPGAGYEIVLDFPHLGRKWADRVLRRLEDIERAQPTDNRQIEQATSLF